MLRCVVAVLRCPGLAHTHTHTRRGGRSQLRILGLLTASSFITWTHQHVLRVDCCCVCRYVCSVLLQEHPNCALSISEAQLHPNGCGSTDPMVRSKATHSPSSSNWKALCLVPMLLCLLCTCLSDTLITTQQATLTM